MGLPSLNAHGAPTVERGRPLMNANAQPCLVLPDEHEEITVRDAVRIAEELAHEDVSGRVREAFHRGKSVGSRTGSADVGALSRG